MRDPEDPLLLFPPSLFGEIDPFIVMNEEGLDIWRPPFLLLDDDGQNKEAGSLFVVEAVLPVASMAIVAAVLMFFENNDDFFMDKHVVGLVRFDGAFINNEDFSFAP